jgi:hypothetical protein
VGRFGEVDQAEVKAAAFLARGLAWGLAGLSLITWAYPGGAAAVALSAFWLAGLTMIAILTQRGSEKNGYGWAASWSAMAALYVGIAAVLWLMI